jgi:predicted kinase
MHTPMLYLMLGYPGSGKTTASKILHELTGAEHLWADHERKQRFTEPTYTHQENLKLYAELNDVADHMLAEGKSVIFDTNFNFYKDREKLRKIAAKHGARSVVVWVVSPKELARERATKDAHKQHTRILGDMSVEHFERISRNLQQPRPDEALIKLDGTKLSAETIKQALEQLQA